MKEYSSFVIREEETPSYIVWFEFSLGGKEGDLCLDAISDLPEESWLEHEIGSYGYEFIIGDYEHRFIADGVPQTMTYMNMALEWGIAPYQPFALKLSARFWQDSLGEHDQWFDLEVVFKEPMSEEAVSSAFFEWESELTRYKQEYKSLQKKRETDTEGMFIREESHGNWARVDLCTVHKADLPFSAEAPLLTGEVLVSGASYEGKGLEAARESMKEKAQELLPHVDLTKLSSIKNKPIFRVM